MHLDVTQLAIRGVDLHAPPNIYSANDIPLDRAGWPATLAR
jgi:hypothetical protein